MYVSLIDFWLFLRVITVLSAQQVFNIVTTLIACITSFYAFILIKNWKLVLSVMNNKKT